jgi:hypothetical protein
MTDIVERVKVDKWTNNDGEPVTSYKVSLVNETGQREVNCYSPLGKDLKEDAPLPEGWEVKTSKAGKPYLAAPRATSGGGGGGRSSFNSSTAWRNTEAGAKYEQERMDRRTALMQAIAWGSDRQVMSSILRSADEAYVWLRESVSTGTGAIGLAADGKAGSGDASTRPVDTPSDEGGGTEYGSTVTASQDSPPPSSSHADKWTPTDSCHCGQPWGPKTTASGKRLCLAGHVEKFDA